MELSLRRRLEGVANIAISQTEQTARIDFAAGEFRFSPGDFRTALDEAGLELVDLQIEACGGIENTAVGQALTMRTDRLRLEYAGAFPVASIVCVVGSVDFALEPATLHVERITSVTE